MDSLDRLKYRRQYILTNDTIKKYKDWNIRNINSSNGKWTIISHPDLEVEQVSNEKKSLVLLGYLIDPENPSFTNKEILNNLSQLSSFNEIINGTDNYNGRFVLICSYNNSVQLFNDATGFREVYYTTKNGKIWCASTPNILKEFLSLELVDSNEIMEFRNSREFKDKDYLWLGYETLIKGVKQLPPNYYLNLLSGKLSRFWPYKRINYIKLDESVEKISFLLKGFIESVCMRYKVHMGITAGWDTRLILSCSKEYKDKIFYYTNKTSALNNKSRDIRIPKKLSNLLGFKLNILEILNDIDESFQSVFYNNNILAHKKLLDVFYHAYKNNYDNTINITGAMGNGLARAYMRIPKRVKTNAESISKIIGYKNIDYVKKVLTIWLDYALDICNEYNINIFDLYQMEQDNAHWGSLTASEQDIVREEMRPFNSRELIYTFWSLEDKYRYQLNPVIYKKIIEKNWKQALSIPVNPSLRSNIMKILRFFNIEQPIYHLYKSLKFNLE